MSQDIGVGKRITNLRESKGWSQAELARRVSLDKAVINRIEKGTRKVTDSEIATFSKIFDVTADFLLDLSDDPKRSYEEEFEAFRNNPQLEVWYRNLPKSSEEELEMLREMFEIYRKATKKDGK